MNEQKQYFEEYWGQRLKDKSEIPEEIERPISFVELAKLNPPTATVSTTSTASTQPSVEEGEGQDEEAEVDIDVSAENSVKSTSANGAEDVAVAMNVESREGSEVSEGLAPPVKKKKIKTEDEDYSDGATGDKHSSVSISSRRRKQRKSEDEDFSTNSIDYRQFDDDISFYDEIQIDQNLEDEMKRNFNGNSFRDCAYMILKRAGRPMTSTALVKIALRDSKNFH